MTDNILSWKTTVTEISKKGPESLEEYKKLQDFFEAVAHEKQKLRLEKQANKYLKTWFNGTMETTDTLQGYTCLCPSGYYGDYVIIDKIYQNHHSTNAVNKNWDRFFQSGNAAQAVRNRKKYFIEKLNQLPAGSTVLNLASGPCRDLLEFASQSDKLLQIDCLDMDIKANKHAQELLKEQKSLDLTFINENIFRFTPSEKYDLIWSAGLFDYFDDAIFQKLIQRLIPNVKSGGNLIVGNFNKGINSQAYMEFGGWFLNYRNHDDLLNLASNLACESKSVEQEELGANLFLNLQL